MSDKTEIANPIKIQDNSVERIAFELMEKIANSESSYYEDGVGKPNSREYYLKLYNQCHKVVYSRASKIDEILKD
ncbi:hypothetical protein [Acinetobacter pollinis]|uniref:hypothetical protein n=1 Tax=Acinetobacter pollinis TaxID=2605270 RepID=UPI0018A2542C|nr:hypothetical protein [Acinetobacter pollinis]MBF7691121.1 hypothetical protein [Acinetobacter pollinis]MBF7698767.1 hypothetical protein [Acinetobacter pollinis]